MNGLCLHAGAKEITREDLTKVATPHGTRTWAPIAHSKLVDMTETALTIAGFEVASQKFGVTEDGHEFFGLLDLKHANAEYNVSLGLRNANNKAFCAGIALGSRVFVCDNRAFSAEFTFQRKHTAHLHRDLPELVKTAVGRVVDEAELQHRRIETYRNYEPSKGMVNNLLIASARKGVIPSSKIMQVLDEYEAPKHPEFKPRNAWSLFNAYTETLKAYPMSSVSDRTQKLHTLCDAMVSAN